MVEIIGQGLGVVAVILGFLSFQMKTQRLLLFMQMLTGVVFCVHYGLIGATAGMALNAVGVVRTFVYFLCEKKNYRRRWVPIAWTVIMGAAGIITWDAWFSVFCLCGLVINTFCLSFSDPQNVRKSILVTSPMVLTYNVFAFSIGGIIYESVVIISSVIGIITYRNLKKKTV